MNLAGWIGVAAPPRLGRGWGRKVKGETRIENNKRNGKPKNLFFLFASKRFPKPSKGQFVDWYCSTDKTCTGHFKLCCQALTWD